MDIKIHWTSIAWTLVTVGCIGYADAQISIPTNVVHTIRPVESPVVTATIVPHPEHGLGRPLHQLVVLHDERGGHIGAHRLRFLGYQREGVKVAIHGGCYSACTMVTGYVGKDDICIAPGAFMAFHSAQTHDQPPRRHMDGTLRMYLDYPKQIRDWLDEQGGIDALPGPNAGYWVLYDRQLWAFGYARCK